MALSRPAWLSAPAGTKGTNSFPASTGPYLARAAAPRPLFPTISPPCASAQNVLSTCSRPTALPDIACYISPASAASTVSLPSPPSDFTSQLPIEPQPCRPASADHQRVPHSPIYRARLARASADRSTREPPRVSALPRSRLSRPPFQSRQDRRKLPIERFFERWG